MKTVGFVRIILKSENTIPLAGRSFKRLPVRKPATTCYMEAG